MSYDLGFARVIDATPERVFDAFTQPGGQEAFYGTVDTGWIVESDCDLRVEGVWRIAFGPARSELYRHAHVFRLIERPHRLLLETTEARLDGSTLKFHTEFIFEPQAGKTRMTISSTGFPTPQLRDEHGLGLPNAFARLGYIVAS